MVNKIQELTDKLYAEGLQKGKDESEKMIDNAKNQSSKMIKEAEQKALEIISDAERKATEFKDNTTREVGLASKQALSDLKFAVKELITKATISSKTSATFNNDEFIKELVKGIVEQWASKGDINAVVEVPADKVEALNSYIASSVDSSMSKGMSIEGGSVKGGFRIANEGGRYFINFTDKEFDGFFKAYVRPRVAAILFNE